MSTTPLVLVDSRIRSIDSYLARHGYASYDPYDGLESPLAHLLPGWYARRVWQQAVRFAPINVRPVLGVHKLVHTKTISDLASAHSLLAMDDAGDSHATAARSLLELLERLRLPTRVGMGWGLRFRFATRFVSADRDTPNSYQTINAIHAFLDGYEALHDEHYLHVAEQGMDFEIEEMGFREVNEGIYWVYWKGLESGVFNISGLMLGLTARLFALTGDDRYRAWSERLLVWLRDGQNADGSWFYSADEKGRWIDGYHTGFVLEGLWRACQASVTGAEALMASGARFYLDEMFTPNGMPLYYHPSRLFPLDIQNLAQAIQTLTLLQRQGLCTLDRLERTLRTVDKHMWNRQGYYSYLKTPVFSYRTPMHRWGTAPMYLALVHAKRRFEVNQRG